MTTESFITLTNRIDAALPQTQCTRCGYPDCAAYAHAIATREAPINQCPPGGAEGVARLAAITGLQALPLNPANGLEAPRAVAVIDEAQCIGCTLCLAACPVDAIFGSNKLMHTVIEPHCTGCELCVPVCPVDCISLETVTAGQTGWAAWSPAQAEAARMRYEKHSYRRPYSLRKPPEKLKETAKNLVEGQSSPSSEPSRPPPRAADNAATDSGAIKDSSSAGEAVAASAPATPADQKQAVIAAAVARARALRSSPS